MTRGHNRLTLCSQTIYELVGGEATFARIADNFYNAVQEDEVLHPLYPAIGTKASAR